MLDICTSLSSSAESGSMLGRPGLESAYPSSAKGRNAFQGNHQESVSAIAQVNPEDLVHKPAHALEEPL